MTKYIIRRLFYGIIVLAIVVMGISAIIHSSPVDPASLTFGQMTDEEAIEAKRKELGLDQSLATQLRYYIRDVSPIAFHENTPENAKKYRFIKLIPLGKTIFVLKTPYLGTSFQSNKSVNAILWQAVPNTAILALTSLFLATIIGIVLGVIASLRQHSWFDNFAVITSVFGYSLPSYVTAMVLAYVFGYLLTDQTGLNATGGLTDINDFGDKIIVWKNLLLPAIALGIRPIAIITQLTRSAMLDVLSQDYVRTAKAKGLSNSTVIIKHALRNALNPVTTAISGWFAALLAGAFFVESVFNYNGLGLETINAVLNFDTPVILGCILFTATVFVLINILVDILYAFLDPRVAF